MLPLHVTGVSLHSLTVTGFTQTPTGCNGGVTPTRTDCNRGVTLRPQAVTGVTSTPTDWNRDVTSALTVVTGVLHLT